MKSNNLLSLLSLLESTLTAFSFEELNSEEAASLKHSFEAFKKMLQAKFHGRVHLADDETQSDQKDKVLDSSLKKSEPGKDSESGLIANVSHEIRTPLNGIIGFADLLKESQLDKDQLEQVNAIHLASHSLLEIVNELLEYSKLAAGLIQFQQLDFNLYGLVRDVMFLCNTLVTNNKTTLTSDIDHNIPKILNGDPSKLTQVLLNVMGNAIKFVEDGKVHLSISSHEQKNNQVLLEFEIEDNGIGIAKDKIGGIFDSFKQAEVETFSKYGGTGLGLTIVRQIVESLGGTISVTSELSVGTTFKFTMPFKRGNQNDTLTTTVKAKINKNDLDALVGLNVLVFEDNILNQRLVEQRLLGWQCNVHITDDGHHGMYILENKVIDLILMDLRMPKMSGFEVTNLVRNSNSRRIRQIPIIALTADYTIRDQEKCNSLGINDYLLKPFSPDELSSKLIASQKDSERSRTLDIIPRVEFIKYESEDSLISLDHIFEDSMHDITMLEELILLFKQNAEEFLQNVKIHLNNEDVSGLAFSAHKMKAGLALIKANRLLKITEEIQKGCDSQTDWVHLEFLVVRFSNEYPAVEKAIDNAIKEMKEN